MANVEAIDYKDGRLHIYSTSVPLSIEEVIRVVDEIEKGAPDRVVRYWINRLRVHSADNCFHLGIGRIPEAEFMIEQARFDWDLSAFRAANNRCTPQKLQEHLWNLIQKEIQDVQ